MVRAANPPQLADRLDAYVVKDHPDKEALREKRMKAQDPMAARAGWNLTAERVTRSPESLDIRFPKHRKRAVVIEEALGLYRDYPVSKGCTSPFAPPWINEMVRRHS